jgi:hypothetical protein
MEPEALRRFSKPAAGQTFVEHLQQCNLAGGAWQLNAGRGQLHGFV